MLIVALVQHTADGSPSIVIAQSSHCRQWVEEVTKWWHSTVDADGDVNVHGWGKIVLVEDEKSVHKLKQPYALAVVNYEYLRFDRNKSWHAKIKSTKCGFCFADEGTWLSYQKANLSSVKMTLALLADNTKICVVATDFMKKASAKKNKEITDVQFAKRMVSYHQRIHAKEANLVIKDTTPIQYLCQSLIMREEKFFHEWLPQEDRRDVPITFKATYHGQKPTPDDKIRLQCAEVKRLADLDPEAKFILANVPGRTSEVRKRVDVELTRLGVKNISHSMGGETGNTKMKDLVVRFKNAPEIRAFLLTEKATHGVDGLKVAKYVIFLDGIASNRQAGEDGFIYHQEVIGRVKRLGSKHASICVSFFQIHTEYVGEGYSGPDRAPSKHSASRSPAKKRGPVVDEIDPAERKRSKKPKKEKRKGDREKPKEPAKPSSASKLSAWSCEDLVRVCRDKGIKDPAIDILKEGDIDGVTLEVMCQPDNKEGFDEMFPDFLARMKLKAIVKNNS